MVTRATIGFAAAGIGAAALAQTPSFVYTLEVANPNLAPGQTTTVTALCGFQPGVGQLVSTPIGPRPVLGLSSGMFNIVGSGGSWSGLALIAPFSFGNWPGIAVGNNVNGVIWGNGFGPPLGVVSTVNPTPVWLATFTAPAVPGPITLTPIPVGNHGVWAGFPGEFSVESISSQTSGVQAVINVIPTPAGLALLGVGLLAAAQRRRSRA